MLYPTSLPYNVCWTDVRFYVQLILPSYVTVLKQVELYMDKSRPQKYTLASTNVH